ncbi:enoyl-ACP reductase [Janibacter sp. Soil728]|uniref:saccharopine dehydrogenase family protein n=1 Tax=Janibacter sp. Soil728 TaxID=1736393 RepID=UPI0007001281|nr:saccharopine dehydrogenase NADP-binding domain-containing protein [Janibacter sp. Soil728]KRE39308.1 enoyl-ACP reductase [Janibacter sp. Soil728]
MINKQARDFDIVLVGATGFVGRLTAGHLGDHAPEGTRIALAGRSRVRLDALAAELGGAAASWPRIVIDVSDPASCADLAARTRVLVTTVGPYAIHGGELVKACALAGTHYADLTGEVLFVRDSAEAFHEVAKRSGARIVHSCGFDSIPSDLGVWETARIAADEGAGTLTDTVLFVRSLKGGLSGGTIDSMRRQAIAVRESLEDRRAMSDPYGLSPDRAAEPTKADREDSTQPSPEARRAGRVRSVTKRLGSRLPVRRTEDGHWTGPFVMATYNTRIVRRSNALLGWRYGRAFRYHEVTDFGSRITAPLRATGMTAGLLGLVTGLSYAPTRKVVDRFLPAPGEGPDEDTRVNGRFALEVVAGTTSGAKYATKVAADADPGYNGTAIMLGQAALCLAQDDLDSEGGVLTPAVAMAAPLIERLRTQGFTISTRRCPA